MATEASRHKQDAIDLHTQESSKFTAWYEAYEENPYSSTFTYGRKKIEEIIEREIAGLPAGTRALDVGCGTGFNLKRFRARGFEVAGIEPSPTMREQARANNPGCDVRDGDIEALPYADGSFDLVISIEVIRYLADPTKGLSEIARCLRPGGTAIVSASPLLSLNGYAILHALTSRVKVPTFAKSKQSFLTVHGAERTMEKAGFATSTVHGVFLGPWHALGRLAPGVLARALQACEPLDDVLSDRGPIRDLTNHLVIVGRR